MSFNFDMLIHSHQYFYDLMPSYPFPKLNTTFFRHWFNRYFVKNHKPHHHGFDILTSPSSEILIRGKFHYGDLRKDLEDEWVSIFMYDFTKDTNWRYLSRKLTDSNGYISHVISKYPFKKGVYLIRMVVEGDNTYTDMYINIFEKGEKFVVFDVDGTLTASDDELIKDNFLSVLNVDYNQKYHDGVLPVVNFYKSEGFQIIYLTARPPWLSSETSKWLKINNFPFGVLRTNEDVLPSSKANIHKSSYLLSLIDKGVDIQFVYGNAETDILAYKTLNLPNDRIFIIGENAGKLDTTSVFDYTSHLSKLKNDFF